MDNTPNSVVGLKKGSTHMTETHGEVDEKCKFCGDDEGITFVVISDRDEEELIFDKAKMIWLCEGHYRKLSESPEYRVRELPAEEFELGHSAREEINDDGEDYVTILEPENENKWLTVPDNLEEKLKENR